MKPYIIHILAILAFFGTGKAMSDPPRIYEEKAIGILNKTSQTITEYDALYLEFQYKSSDSFSDMFDDATAYIYVSGEKYYIKMGDMHFISDGVLAWTFLEDVNEVHISYLEDTEAALSPLSLIENFEEDFRPLWIRQETSHDGEMIDIIDMVPLEHHPFFKYRLAISSKNHHVGYTIAYDSHGGTYTYIVTDTLINPEIPPDLFSFNPDDHPGIEVVDLR